MKGLMNGVRVLEVAAWTYVPSAGAVLAEWGADVLKVEHPENGDPQRGLVNMGLVPKAPGDINHMIELPNRGKRSVGIDMSSEGGREALLKLAATSDVFLTNFLPGPRKRLRIDVDDIREANPNIIYVRGSGNGQEGPEAEKGGYDGCSFWHRTTADIVTKDGDYPVPPPGPAYGDMLGGLIIAGGISAALFHRERTGEALVVDNSLLANGMWATSATILTTSLFGMDRLAMASGDRTQVFNPLVNVYKTSDGRFLSLMMLQGNRFWPEVAKAIGRPELLDDPRFAEGPSQNGAECVKELDATFATKTYDEWREILSGIQGVWAPVQQPGEMVREPQALANGYVVEVEAASGSRFNLVPSPLKYDGETPSLTRAPEHGEHTDEVLLEAGYSMDEVIELKISGAIL